MKGPSWLARAREQSKAHDLRPVLLSNFTLGLRAKSHFPAIRCVRVTYPLPAYVGLSQGVGTRPMGLYRTTQIIARTTTPTASPPHTSRTRYCPPLRLRSLLYDSLLCFCVFPCSSFSLKTSQNDPRRRLVLSPAQVRQGLAPVVRTVLFPVKDVWLIMLLYHFCRLSHSSYIL